MCGKITVYKIFLSHCECINVFLLVINCESLCYNMLASVQKIQQLTTADNGEP